MNRRFPTLASQSLNTAECLETELVLDLILSFSKGILDLKKSDIVSLFCHIASISETMQVKLVQIFL